MSESQYFLNLIVDKDAIDSLGHVNNVVYLKWAQDIAAAHWNERASEAIKERYFWVVSSHFIEYKRPSFEGDEVKLYTHVLDDAKGATWGRKVWMECDGKLLATVTSQWCLMDKLSQKPTRITIEILRLFE